MDEKLKNYYLKHLSGEQELELCLTSRAPLPLRAERIKQSKLAEANQLAELKIPKTSKKVDKKEESPIKSVLADDHKKSVFFEESTSFNIQKMQKSQSMHVINKA